jgi:hypothetical protein
VAAALLAALLAAARPAAAQGGLGVNPFSVGVSGGLSVPTGDFSDVFASGFNVDGLLAVRAPTLPVSLRIEAGYQRFALKESVRDLLGQFGGSGDVTARILSGTANVVYGFTIPASPVRPYLIGGVGVYNLRARASGAFAELAEEFGGTIEQSTTRLGLNGGLGLDVPLAGITVFGEARVHTIFTPSERDPDTGERFGGRTTIVPLKIGVRF